MLDALCLVGPTGVQRGDFFCSGDLVLLLISSPHLCFILVLILELCYDVFFCNDALMRMDRMS